MGFCWKGIWYIKVALECCFGLRSAILDDPKMVKKNSKMLRPFLQTKYSPKTPHSESEFQTPRGTISALKRVTDTLRKSNRILSIINVFICFIFRFVSSPSPAPQSRPHRLLRLTTETIMEIMMPQSKY